MPINRRHFLTSAGLALLTGPSSGLQPTNAARPGVTLFLCGDVMTGRGIDQVLAHPGKPHLQEQYVRASGPIERPVASEYIWGDALAELERVRPDARIVNLETAVTTAEDAWPGKAVHYRMHPANVSCLTAARIDCCVLANNHVLD
jgi:poly-gamma-glutamate synthesis protein (capsule biosynthesis protein)